MKNGSLAKRRIALYNPYLDTLGGGEKHILSILKVLEDEGCEISIFWDKNLQNEIQNRFALQFKNKLIFLPNIFKTKDTLRTLKTLQTFDYFFYVTDGSYFFSPAKIKMLQTNYLKYWHSLSFIAKEFYRRYQQKVIRKT